MQATAAETFHFPVVDYDLAATLDCGQAFRWQRIGEGWEGCIGGNWTRLRAEPGAIVAEVRAGGAASGLAHYLQTEIPISEIVASFPADEPMRAAVEACNGLRLLRQPPWETLASFLLSSTKQIVQIRQVIDLMCRRFGERLPADSVREWFSFPAPERIAALDESDLRACKMGFRAPYLLTSARAVAEGRIDLTMLAAMSCAEARTQLDSLPGVGRKIADCVLLFGCGFQDAFPVDVWVMKALRHFYFSRRRPKPARLLRFSETHFGPFGGYAQQYLFHYARVKARHLFPPRKR